MNDTEALEALEKVCYQFLGDLVEPNQVRCRASYGADQLTVHVDAPDDADINEAIIGIFFDIFYYLPLDSTKSTFYRFEWTSYKDLGLTQKAHEWLLETDVAYMPDTGGVTEAKWAAFLDQFGYLKDGQPQDLEFTPEFHDEEAE